MFDALDHAGVLTQSLIADPGDNSSTAVHEPNLGTRVPRYLFFYSESDDQKGSKKAWKKQFILCSWETLLAGVCC